MSNEVKSSLTFVSVTDINLDSTGEKQYLADIKKLNSVNVVDIITIKTQDEKKHSDINNQPGRKFISVQGSEKIYQLVGYNVFAKSVLSIGGIKKIAVLTEKKNDLENVLRSSNMRIAFARQKDRQ